MECHGLINYVKIVGDKIEPYVTPPRKIHGFDKASLSIVFD